MVGRRALGAGRGLAVCPHGLHVVCVTFHEVSGVTKHVCCRVVLFEGDHRCPVAFIFGAGKGYVLVLAFVVFQSGGFNESQVEVGQAFGMGGEHGHADAVGHDGFL